MIKIVSILFYGLVPRNLPIAVGIINAVAEGIQNRVEGVLRTLVLPLPCLDVDLGNNLHKRIQEAEECALKCSLLRPLISFVFPQSNQLFGLATLLIFL